MTTEREMLEYAAKACGIETTWNEQRQQFMYQPYKYIDNDWNVWNPIKHSSDCAAMCANLMIDTLWVYNYVVCRSDETQIELKTSLYEDKESAWRFAACKVAEAIGRAMR